ncbi:LysR family transcriptional regulator [Gorillibacterium sp. sgz5001074]|uniref:LysR family transcriptional regulator n=1 Tax=Gorillibacterium sp. sgz5001074 TaxID=3446695 RepID=UPI003F6759FD
MDIRQLKYFLTIAEEGQITSAAKKLRMAQPPLSQQLKQLEDELGVKLMERGPRHIRLTDAGEMLLRRARQIIELTESTAREIADSVKGWTGTLTIGTVSSSGATLLRHRLTDFHQSHPGVKYEIHEGNTFQVMEMVTSGIVEIGIVRTPFSLPGNMGCRITEKEPMAAVMTREHGWKGEEAVTELAELRDKPLIIYRRFEELIRTSCQDHGFDPVFICMNDDARTTLMWAGTGLGIGIVPRSAVFAANSSGLMVKEIVQESMQTSVAAIWMKDKYISKLAQQFLERFGT